MTPGVTGAGSLLAQPKRNCTSAGSMGAVGVKASTKLWAAPAAISTGVLREPVSALVAGSVV